jgi:hypothetical protein
MRLILVTGAPRSGTTAVGQMMSFSPRSGRLHEPFNYHVGLKQIRKYFEIPGSQSFSLQQLDHTVQTIKQRDLQFKRGVFPSDQGFMRMLKYFFGGRAKNSYRLLRLHPGLDTIIWKDPLACFAADHVAKQHQVDVLVTFRHPWAVAASFKRMEWALDLPDIIMRLQQAGMDFTGMLALLDRPINISVINGAILWQVIYSTLYQWAQQNPRIRFIDLDDVVDDPVRTYEKLYHLFALDWDKRVIKKILKYYGNKSGRREPKSKKAHDHGRNVSEVNKYWRDYLTEQEKDFVAEVAEKQWSEFRKICLE